MEALVGDDTFEDADHFAQTDEVLVVPDGRMAASKRELKDSVVAACVGEARAAARQASTGQRLFQVIRV
jgi:hypothetical protein